MAKLSRALQGLQLRAIAIDAVHQRMHEGLFFTASVEDSNLSGDLDVLCQVPQGVGVHLRARAKASDDFRLQIYENTQFSAAGASLAGIDRNRFTQTEDPITLTTGPTIGEEGDLIYSELTPVSGLGTSPESEVFEEFILGNPSSPYLIRLTALGAAGPANLQIDYYDSRTTVR